MQVADLPGPVRRDVESLESAADFKPEGAAHVLRTYAAQRVNAACMVYALREWSQTIEHLSVAIGYLTAANRVEEPNE